MRIVHTAVRGSRFRIGALAWIERFAICLILFRKVGVSSSTAWRGASAGVAQTAGCLSDFRLKFRMGRRECDLRFDPATDRCSRKYHEQRRVVDCLCFCLLLSRPEGQRACHSKDPLFTSDECKIIRIYHLPVNEISSLWII